MLEKHLEGFNKSDEQRRATTRGQESQARRTDNGLPNIASTDKPTNSGSQRAGHRKQEHRSQRHVASPTPSVTTGTTIGDTKAIPMPDMPSTDISEREKNYVYLCFPETFWDYTSMEEPPGPKPRHPPEHVRLNPGTPWPLSYLSKNKRGCHEDGGGELGLPLYKKVINSLCDIKSRRSETVEKELWDPNRIEKIKEMTPLQTSCYLSIKYDHDPL
jgi:hypothetical protein